MTFENFIYILLIISLLPFLILIIYPISALFISKINSNPVKKSFENLPPVTIIISCYNEEKYIKQRIDHFLNKEEWLKGSELIIVAGGSTDNTNNILANYLNQKNVTVIISNERMTKIQSVNLAVTKSKNELLIFSDCRQRIKPGSVRQLIANFADSDVGTVTSTLHANINPEKFSIRKILNYISRCESQSGSSLNVFGALYAQRKSVFKTIPEDLLFDDLFVVVSTLIQNKRLIMEPDAIIYDLSFEEYYKTDRIRRLTRGLLLFFHHHFGLIWKLRIGTFFRFIMFKYLKLLLPFAIAISILCLITLILFYPLNQLQLIILSLLILLGIITSKYVIHLTLINIQIAIAIIRYYFFNEKTNSWNKLN